MILSIGADHAGFPLKACICEFLRKEGHEMIDHGCYNGETVDFPVIAQKVCQSIKNGDAERGIVICGSGVGAAIACNKISGMRASCCHDLYSAHQCVEHDNVNVACIGADIIGPKLACELLHCYLQAEFSSEPEFQNRVAMLSKMDEQQNLL